ncbi:hypothetical protein [Hymenobacter persicinus]|uniref:Uncharacterized protein n=1 Tax=Hymenobacter persicinus TaxID=2025506 RepID=A0A4Q5LCN7_9BACT|nr:hypothetical protein [Hymenobacter persicinus]RYU80273.1 hypothetical protein EWM57_08800 [Hymenobacter persicinus]
MPNEFQTAIPAPVLAQVQESLNAIKAALAPYLISLTPEERKAMLRMGDKTVAFVQKTADYATNSPALLPPFVDFEELKQDLKGVTQLTPLAQQLEQLTLDVDSTLMVAGSEAYGNALTIYNNVRFLAQNHQSGAQAAYEDLRQRFPGRPALTREAKQARAAAKLN